MTRGIEMLGKYTVFGALVAYNIGLIGPDKAFEGVAKGVILVILAIVIEVVIQLVRRK